MMHYLRLQFIIIVTLTGSIGSCAAQILITPQITPTGLIKKDQLWNIVLVNNNETAQDIQIQVSMLDIRTGQKVLTGSSRLFTTTKGARQLQINDVSPVQYNYGSAAFIADRAGNGLLPIGNFQLCYTLIEGAEKNSLPTQEECIPVEIQPLSPAQLQAPSSNDTVTTTYPLFQWIPPAPLTMFTDLNYEFLLVEMNRGQKANEAIQKNTPLYSQNLIRNMFLAYPSSAVALEEGKTYGWQIIARNGNSYAEKTEAWTFTVKKELFKLILDYEAYPSLRQGSTGDFYICQGKIKASYKNELNDSTLEIKFFRQSNHAQPPVFAKVVSIQSGQNYIDLDINGNRVFQDGETYVLETVNTRNEKWTLGFKYKAIRQ